MTAPKIKKPKCQGKRRMWRGHTLGTFKCTRNATVHFFTSVGYSRSHFCCDDRDCYQSITHGYRATNIQDLKTGKYIG